MAIKLGNKNINKAYLGGVEIKKLYLGANVIFDNTFIPFIIEVDTANTGTSNDNQFQFTGAEGDYDVVAKQNDIVVASFNGLSGAETITLPSSGVYDLEVFPKASNGFNRIRFSRVGDMLKITDIKQWGDVVWSSFHSAFWDCSNMLVTATDIPNLSNVTRMNNMFRSASIANPDVSNWDVSSVDSMHAMFMDNSVANPDVSNWITTSIDNLSYMFANASSANPDIYNWDVSSVTDKRRMFGNSNLSEENQTACYENWSQLQLQQNVEFNAGDTQYFEAGQAGRDILVNTYNWTITDGGVKIPFIIEVNTANTGVSNADQFQFTGAEGDYDVVAKQGGVITDTFNDLSNEATITFSSSGIYDLEVFPKASNGFNRIRFNAGGDKDKMLDIKQWGTIVWSSFDSAFDRCENMLVTTSDIPNFIEVTITNRMFRFCYNANPDVSNWDMSNVNDMQRMFQQAKSATPNVSQWNTSSLVDMDDMFERAEIANPNCRDWDVSNVRHASQAFNLCNISTENLTAIYENWSQLNLQQNVSFSAGNTKYNSSGQAGRDILVNTYNWTITDGGQV
jgi:surface protein